MAMIDAFRFATRCRSDREFRIGAYGHSEGGRVKSYWRESGYSFEDDEFARAIESLLLRAVDEDEADELHDLRRWYSAVSGSDGSAGNCGASACSGTCHSCHSAKPT